MLLDNKVYVGYADGEKVCINLSKANRHGLIAGATGTGKTTTLRVIAESFSNAGVPVFLADAKGDLATLCQPGTMVEPVQKRMDEMGLAADGFQFQQFPVAGKHIHRFPRFFAFFFHSTAEHHFFQFHDLYASSLILLYNKYSIADNHNHFQCYL